MSRVDVAGTGDERALLTGWLDWHRETVHVKCAGLAERDAWRTPLSGRSLTSAAGVVSHLTAVESYWFERVVAGLDVPVGWTADDPDLDWRRAPGATLAGHLAGYRRQCEVSRSVLAGADLDATCPGSRPGTPVSVRWVVLHMIEETARHNGHLDAVRELVDGIVGE
ncbi:DinB family protein [Dactylosporangium aurantiacum]|uniref:DinB family protein n=1 Tax=Dactylosporangium aurantiacum TaxID=35754 RepID=A0A9Q9IGY3_9ACTN|nr:DinB family protein [Dactylosporangium aurantiacum]MDG6102532.1 DinB family protein [Dactylosporangium aurantiacum]UWZ53194.1 DinB family protein [Dactylosporangium aurantiacum]